MIDDEKLAAAREWAAKDIVSWFRDGHSDSEVTVADLVAEIDRLREELATEQEKNALYVDWSDHNEECLAHERTKRERDEARAEAARLKEHCKRFAASEVEKYRSALARKEAEIGELRRMIETLALEARRDLSRKQDQFDAVREAQRYIKHALKRHPYCSVRDCEEMQLDAALARVFGEPTS